MSTRFAKAEAERIIDNFGFDVESLPIDIKAIAKDLNLRVVEAELDDDVSGLLVAKQTINDQVHIFVNKTDSLVRKRFTISHEIGHYVLAHKFEASGVHVDRGNHVIPRKTNSGIIEQREVEANEFAACLLMPSKLVMAAVKEIGLPLFDHHVTELATTFKVSEQAMTIRLSRLGIL